MVAKLVAQMKKTKANNLAGGSKHNYREFKYNSNPEINNRDSYRNYDLIMRSDTDIKSDVMDYINETKSTNRKVRSDAVVVNEWIISSSNDFFDDLGLYRDRTFFEKSKEYFCEKFGKENVRYAVVHMDETTPHMHLGVVPFDEDKKLSAKRVFGKKTLLEIQEELPAYLQKHGFDIERGDKGSERKHLSTADFKEWKDQQKIVNQNRKAIDKLVNYDQEIESMSLEKNN